MDYDNLPGINVLVAGGMGYTPGSNDGVAGLIISGIATSEIALETTVLVQSIEDVVALGIDSVYDTENVLNVYRDLKSFYDASGDGASLYLMLVDPLVTLTEMLDKNGNYASALLDYANGNIRLLAVNRFPDDSYTADLTNGLDGDVISAMPIAQQLAESYTSRIMPLMVLIGGRNYTGEVASLANLKLYEYNRVGISLLGAKDSPNANIGLLLGRLARIPVSEKIGWVEAGNIFQLEVYLTDGKPISNRLSELNTIAGLHYIIALNHPHTAGSYFGRDFLATKETDDYKFITNRRLIDKALVLAYKTMLPNIERGVQMNSEGKLELATIQTFETQIENTINRAMSGEISSANAIIKASQNVIASGVLAISIEIQPLAYLSKLKITLGLKNLFKE